MTIIVVAQQIKPSNHITYLNRVNEIDSIYRFKKDTLLALTMYDALFKEFPPHNSYMINEYQSYIVLSNMVNRDFGGKKSLYKLIPLIAPNWKYNKMDKDLLKLYKKYGIDSLEVEGEIGKWKRSLNKRLVDSFSIASLRDQEKNRRDGQLQRLNDKKNRELLTWTFNNYGYPSVQKIGIWGNNDVFMPMNSILNHIGGSSSEDYIYFRDKILEYIKLGDCNPEDYAYMVDKRAGSDNMGSVYGVLYFNKSKTDTIVINRNRKKIGMPSLQHSKKILEDFLKN